MFQRLVALSKVPLESAVSETFQKRRLIAIQYLSSAVFFTYNIILKTTK